MTDDTPRDPLTEDVPVVAYTEDDLSYWRERVARIGPVDVPTDTPWPDADVLLVIGRFLATLDATRPSGDEALRAAAHEYRAAEWAIRFAADAEFRPPRADPEDMAAHNAMIERWRTADANLAALLGESSPFPERVTIAALATPSSTPDAPGGDMPMPGFPKTFPKTYEDWLPIDGEWHHVVVVHKPEQIAPDVYIDGAKRDKNVTLGGIYNRVLTDEEIEAHYRAAVGTSESDHDG